MHLDRALFCYNGGDDCLWKRRALWGFRFQGECWPSLETMLDDSVLSQRKDSWKRLVFIRTHTHLLSKSSSDSLLLIQASDDGQERETVQTDEEFPVFFGRIFQCVFQCLSKWIRSVSQCAFLTQNLFKLVFVICECDITYIRRVFLEDQPVQANKWDGLKACLERCQNAFPFY